MGLQLARSVRSGDRTKITAHRLQCTLFSLLACSCLLLLLLAAQFPLFKLKLTLNGWTSQSSRICFCRGAKILSLLVFSL